MVGRNSRRGLCDEQPLVLAMLGLVLWGDSNMSEAQFRRAPIPQSRAMDPGVRLGNPDAGLPLDGLTPRQTLFFEAGKAEFEEAEEIDEGIGPEVQCDELWCVSQPTGHWRNQSGGESTFECPEPVSGKRPPVVPYRRWASPRGPLQAQE